MDDSEILRLRKEGKGLQEIADVYGVNASTISRRLKKIGVAVNRRVALFDAGRLVDAQMDSAQQLRALGYQIREILELIHVVLHEPDGSTEYAKAAGKIRRLTGYKRDRDLMSYLVALQGELRKQLELDHRVTTDMYNLRSVMDFQNIVLEEIKAVSPEVQQRIAARLVELGMGRSSDDFTGGASAGNSPSFAEKMASSSHEKAIEIERL